jgi:uncharacterized membrane protein (UPF0127 family)
MNTKVIIALVVIIVVSVFFARQVTPKNLSQTSKTDLPSASINGHVFSLEIAKTEAQRERGLSYRPSLPQDTGMLFLFEKPGQYSFWMKDMHFPLDMIYINNDTVVYVFKNVPPPRSLKQTLPIYTPDTPADKVLEINAGLSKKYGIKKGNKVKFKI